MKPSDTQGPTRINLGCGASPTIGWLNYDNSLTVRLGRHPLFLGLGVRLNVVSADQRRFAEVAARTPIRWADVSRRIPAPDNSIDAVYSSHMLEHLDRPAADSLLLEVRRVLKRKGVLRLAVPDMAILAAEYNSIGDCDTFIARTHLASPRPRTMMEKLRWLLVGDRGHAWMYDGPSLVECLRRQGFEDPTVLAPGETIILEPGKLDLREREEESLYVEAYKP